MFLRSKQNRSSDSDTEMPLLGQGKSPMTLKPKRKRTSVTVTPLVGRGKSPITPKPKRSRSSVTGTPLVGRGKSPMTPKPKRTKSSVTLTPLVGRGKSPMTPKPKRKLSSDIVTPLDGQGKSPRTPKKNQRRSSDTETPLVGQRKSPITPNKNQQRSSETETPLVGQKKSPRTPKKNQQKSSDAETPLVGQRKSTRTPKKNQIRSSDAETPLVGQRKSTRTPKHNQQRSSDAETSLVGQRKSTRTPKPKLKDETDDVGHTSSTGVQVQGGSSTPTASLKMSAKTQKSKQNHEVPKDTSKLELNIPCPLPCREEQFQDIWSFLKNNLTERDSSCLYVAGVPGTGKTLIVKAVVKALREASDGKKGPDFTDIYINGLSLSAPNQIWKRFYQELSPDKGKIKLTPDKACIKLQLYFEKQHKPVILIIDELDQILDKQQAILYRLLEWTASPSCQFSLICIFNTMNLPEKVMTMRNASRMGMSRCTFPPYTRVQLGTIVQNYLGTEKAAKLGEAVSLLSSKVASISGDARRAIEISKRTLEIVEESGVSGVVAVSEAFKELFSSPRIKALRNCSKLEKLILQMIVSDLHTTGSEETVVHSIVNSTYAQCLYEGWNINADTIVQTLGRLYQSRIILIDSLRTSIHNKVSLNVPIVDIQFALGKTNEE